jgi:UDPglucose 6-dehydrogenase
LKLGEFPVSEPSLLDLAKKNSNRIHFCSDASMLSRCDVVYIAPDVATDDQGASDLTEIESLLQIVLNATRKDTVHVVLSQVPPGFTRARQVVGRHLYYQVETLIFGRAVERALYPERYIVGCANPDQPLPTSFARFLEAHDCPILPMRLESAELAKISINMCLVASVSVANTMAELCEEINADWSEIVPALKLDKRIGQHAYLSPGLGLSGGNLERDLSTVCRLADLFGTDSGVVKSWIANSRYRKDWVLRTLWKSVLSSVESPVIAILGLSYKENTHSTKNSPALALIEGLTPFAIRVFDPVVPATVVNHPNCYQATSELDACNGADTLIVMTPWPQFAAIKAQDITSSLKGRSLIDPYGIFNANACRAMGLSYQKIGTGLDS